MTRRSRRGFLAAVGVGGVAALAGCSSLPWDEESEPSYDREALGEIAALGYPALPRRTPAPIDSAYLDDRRSAVRAELDAVPAEIPESDIPNGVVRAEVAESRSRATDALARAESAATPFERLGDLRGAYGWAAEARGGYRAVVDGLTMDAALADRPEIRADLQSFREERRVVGGFDGATVVLQATVDDYLGTVDRQLGRAADQSRAENRALGVAEAVGAVTGGRTYLADARHLYEEFRASRETRPVGEAFGRAADALLADVRRRQDALPGESFTENPARYLDVTGDLGQPAHELVTRTYRDAARERDPDADGESAASRLLAARRQDHALRSFARVRNAVEAGEHAGPADAGTVRAAKLDALAALERARSDPAHPALTPVAANGVETNLRFGDRQLADLADGYGDPSDRATDAYVAYAQAEAYATTVEPTNARLVGAIAAAGNDEPVH